MSSAAATGAENSQDETVKGSRREAMPTLNETTKVNTTHNTGRPQGVPTTSQPALAGTFPTSTTFCAELYEITVFVSCRETSHSILPESDERTKATSLLLPLAQHQRTFNAVLLCLHKRRAFVCM